MTEEKKENLAHNNYPYGSEMPIGSRDRSLYENKKESFLNGLNAAINYTHCCKSDSEQLFDFLEWFNNYCTVDTKPNKEDVELYLSK